MNLKVSLFLKWFLTHISLESFPSAFASVPICFFTCLFKQITQTFLCPKASSGDSLTVPITTRALFNNSSQLAVGHFFFSSSSCHFFSYPADHITASMAILHSAAIQVEAARLKLKTTVSFAVKHLCCWVLQRISASTLTESQALYLNSCGAVKSSAMVS